MCVGSISARAWNELRVATGDRGGDCVGCVDSICVGVGDGGWLGEGGSVWSSALRASAVLWSVVSGKSVGLPAMLRTSVCSCCVGRVS